DPPRVRITVFLSGRLQMPGRDRGYAAAGDACFYDARRQDYSFLGHRDDDEQRRHGLAVLEPDGLPARGPTGPRHAAAKVQVRIPGEKLFEQVAAWSAPRF